MKNTGNLALAVLLFVVLGCACPRLDKLTVSGPPPAPSPPSNTGNGPSKPSGPSSGKDLTLAKFAQLKDDMPISEVERILGGPGEEVSSSKGGGITFTVYKWSEENFTSVIITFRQGKLMTKTQVGLK